GRWGFLRRLREHRAAEHGKRERQCRAKEGFRVLHRAPCYSSLQTYSIRAHACAATPLTVAGRNLQSSRPARAASSSRREPDERSTLLSSTLPFVSMRKLSSTVPVSFARRADGGYSGFSHDEASTTGAVLAGAGAGVGVIATGAGG